MTLARSIAALCSGLAAGLAALAAVVSNLDSHDLAFRFFVAAGSVAAAQAWATTLPSDRLRFLLVVGIAYVGLAVATFIDVLTLLARGSGPDRPGPLIEATYLGLTATAYHLLALHGGAILVSLSALLVARQRHGSRVR